MKQLTVLSISLVIFFAMTSIASAGDNMKRPENRVKIIQISFSQALDDPQLVLDMQQQIINNFLGYNQTEYTIPVYSQNALYMITGTYLQWEMFFYSLVIIRPKRLDKAPTSGKS